MGDEVKPKVGCGQFAAGVAIGLAAGTVGNALAMAIAGQLFGAMTKHNPVMGIVLGILPGIGLIIVARQSTGSMSHGMLTAAIIILLTGGLCGGGVAGLFG